MTSKEFFGNYKFVDIHITLFNAKGERIYKDASTTFAYAKPLIKTELNYALNNYKNDWEQNGDAVKAEIFTTPNWKSLTFEIATTKKGTPKFNII